MGKKQLASWFNLTYRYIDDVFSLNNPEFENYLGQMYPAELEIKDTRENITSASYTRVIQNNWDTGRKQINNKVTNFIFGC